MGVSSFLFSYLCNFCVLLSGRNHQWNQRAWNFHGRDIDRRFSVVNTGFFVSLVAFVSALISCVFPEMCPYYLDFHVYQYEIVHNILLTIFLICMTYNDVFFMFLTHWWFLNPIILDQFHCRFKQLHKFFFYKTTLVLVISYSFLPQNFCSYLYKFPTAHVYFLGYF